MSLPGAKGSVVSRVSPEISVLLPVYNAAKFVEAAVLSVLAQSFSDFELIIIDDGSTDGSGPLLQALAATDKRIRLVQRENRGLIATLNEGIALAKAPLLARMDADDVSLPERLAIQVSRMRVEPDLVALGGGIQYMDAAGRLGRAVPYPSGKAVDEALLWGAPLAHPAVMLRTHAVREAGGYPALFPHAEDYALWLRLRENGRIDNVPQTLLRYRLHGASASHVHALTQRTSTLRAQALWLAGEHASPSIMQETSNEAFLQSLPLTEAQRIDIMARMLALSPHLIGDEATDQETAQWLKIVRAAPANPCRKRGLALFYLRVARVYAAEPLRRLLYLALALVTDPGIVLPMLRKVLAKAVS